MKIIRFFSLLLLVIMTGCSSDDSGKATLHGKWKLTNVNGGDDSDPVNDNFTIGSITWTFNSDQTVTIVNTNTDDALSDLLDSGTYDYEIVDNSINPDACGKAITVDGIDYGCFHVTSEMLTFSQNDGDFYFVTFVR